MASRWLLSPKACAVWLFDVSCWWPKPWSKEKRPMKFQTNIHHIIKGDEGPILHHVGFIEPIESSLNTFKMLAFLKNIHSYSYTHTDIYIYIHICKYIHTYLCVISQLVCWQLDQRVWDGGIGQLRLGWKIMASTMMQWGDVRQMSSTTEEGMCEMLISLVELMCIPEVGCVKSM